MRSILNVFALSFALNLAWEYAHAPLYVHYQGGVITDFILFRAAVGDGVMLVLLALPFMFVPLLASRRWLFIPTALALAVLVEKAALAAGRWAYGPDMPLVPFLHTGLTPTIQLALLGWIAYSLTIWRKR